MKAKRGIIIIGLVVIVALSYYLPPSKIMLTSSIPTVFKNQSFQHKYINGMTFVTDHEQVTYPISDDDKYLYVLNGAGDDFRKYYLDKQNKKVVIRKNIVDPKIRDKEYYQVVIIPKEDLQPLIYDGKIIISIEYMYLAPQSTVLEYDFSSKQAKILSHSLIGK
jgi:hypothetical protein